MSRLGRLVVSLAALLWLAGWSGNAIAAVSFQAAGTAVTGTGAVTPTWPAHAINDIALLFVESAGGQPATLSTPAGFVAVTNSPQATGAGTAGTRLTVFWARATSAAMAAPTVADPGDHVYAQIITYRGAVTTGNPWDNTGGGIKDNTVTVTGVTTGVANTRIVQAVTRETDSAAAVFSAQTNANLTGITERADAGSTSGDGGGFAVWDGVLATAGATGDTTTTASVASFNAFLTIALKPQAAAAPTFQAAGTAVTGTGAVTPTWPAHAINDIALLFVESIGSQAATLSTPAGFAPVPNSPQSTVAGGTGTRLTVFWARATSAAMGAPTVADPGNHAYAQIITYRGAVNAGNPWDVTEGGVRDDVILSSVSTSVPDTLIVQTVTRDNDLAAAAFSAETNANLTGITERSDAGTASGNGGGFAVWDGTMAAAGATGNTTTAVAVASVNAFLTIALKPQLTCFTDDFNRADGAPAGNWVVANEGGSFGNPRIVSNRLRLTDATNAVSTMAALQQLFPAAGNRIVVEFDDFAYNGSGADGMGVVLSDASIAPVPGAFGGSLGYAPKQASQGGDTTHPGFAGGWIGLAIDEYGNYSANTEGRSGGPAPGQTIDSVAIRGSGSAYTGYPYHRGTTTLSPGIDVAGATPGPGYRYRITIDHTNGVNAWTSVERDTGSGYVSLIAAYDAKAEAGQAAVPTNWYLSFTGSTGSSTNIHEVDNLQICSINPQPLPTLHHIRLLHDTAALTCAAETVTVKACANANCDTLYLGSVTADLTNIAGATWSSDPVTFTGGQTSITLTTAAAGAVTLGAAAVPPVNPTRCFNGVTETCTLTYTASSTCFDAVETAGSPSTPIYTKLSGTAFSLDVLAVNSGVINSGYTGTVAVDLVDPTALSGNCGDANAGLTAAVNYTFTSVDAGRRTYSFNYPYAAANAKVRIRDTSVSPVQPTCSVDNFAIRPQQFALSTTAALNPATNTLAAGANFNLTANPGAAVTSGYTGTPVVDTANIVDHNSAAIGAGAWSGSFTPIAAPGGGSLASNFQYHDVGTLTLNADAVKDANFTAVDQVTGVAGGVDHGSNGDCVSASTSNTLASGKYGCVIGSGPLGPLGRFIPDHFALTLGSIVTRSASSCAPASSFTYMDEPMKLVFTLTAQSAAPINRVTGNYVGAHAKLDPTNLALWPDGQLGVSPSMALGAIDTAGPTLLSTRMSVTGVTATGWAVAGSEGSNTITATAKLTRGVSPDGAYGSVKLGIDPRDSDGVRFASYDLDANNDTTNERLQIGGTTSFRYGRLRLMNTYGSELLDIRVPLRAEYYNGTGWSINTLDNCTALPTGAMAVSGGLAPVVQSASPITLSGGLGTLIFNKTGVTGSFNLAANLNAAGADASCNTAHGGTAANMLWLQGFWAPAASCGGTAAWAQDPNARIKLGASKAPYIYLRERY